jgi:hypothetical protein
MLVHPDNLALANNLGMPTVSLGRRQFKPYFQVCGGL